MMGIRLQPLRESLFPCLALERYYQNKRRGQEAMMLAHTDSQKSYFSPVPSPPSPQTFGEEVVLYANEVILSNYTYKVIKL